MLRTASSARRRITTGTVRNFHGYEDGKSRSRRGRGRRLGTIRVWWGDVVREGTREGQHTTMVQRGRRMGMRRFIVSEVSVLVALFWGYYWSALAPTPEIGGVWPPKGVEVLNEWEVPLRNTLILLTSGVSVTWAHHGRVGGSRDEAVKGRRVTVRLALRFTARQGVEYGSAKFTRSDSVYGSTFYMATGFHGFHVRIGTMSLGVGYATTKGVRGRSSVILAWCVRYYWRLNLILYSIRNRRGQVRLWSLRRLAVVRRKLYRTGPLESSTLLMNAGNVPQDQGGGGNGGRPNGAGGDGGGNGGNAGVVGREAQEENGEEPNEAVRRLVAYHIAPLETNIARRHAHVRPINLLESMYQSLSRARSQRLIRARIREAREALEAAYREKKERE